MPDKPNGLVAVRPTIAGSVIPVPGQARPLAEGDLVDGWDAYWAGLLADGSIEPMPAAPAKPTAKSGG